MKAKFFYLLAALILLFTSCRKSSLSDIELDDPSILKVYAKVGKYTNLDSTVIESHVFNLRIKDKTDHSIELKKEILSYGVDTHVSTLNISQIKSPGDLINL